MFTVLFVHGTGSRRADYATTFGIVSHALVQRWGDRVTVQACLWGDVLGYEQHYRGLCLPPPHGIADAQVLGDAPQAAPESLSADEILVACWSLLYDNPLAEVHTLAAEQPPAAALSLHPQAAASQTLGTRLATLAFSTVAPALQEQLQQGEIAATFDQAVALVRADPTVQQGIGAVTSDTLPAYGAAVARAVVAAALAAARQPERTPRLEYDASVRDATVALLTDELDQAPPAVLGVGQTVVNASVRSMLRLPTAFMRWRRRPLMDRTLLFLGDVLRYQARGQEIRDYIARKIPATGPTVLLAHSLGGVACADVLLMQDLRDRVPLLITVGSQFPALYEISAVQSLQTSATPALPAQLPPWLNIADPNDFLSFVGAKLFGPRIRDVQVNNRQPFPQAHTSYWTNDQVWRAIHEAIAEHLS